MTDRSDAARRRRLVRLGILLSLLALVLLYAAHRTLRDRARRAWERPLQVAFVLVPVGPLDPELVVALRARLPALEDALGRELRRHRATPARPFELAILGPSSLQPPPPEPTGESFLELAGYAWNRWRWTRAIDPQLAVDPGDYDARVYLAVRRTAGRVEMVEGASEQGGHVGVVTCDLDPSTLDWTLSVAAHETLHTVGATDKYDDAGHARAPDGLGEPDKQPLYPQTTAEIMSRGVALTESSERPLAHLDELRVGTQTAAEIGWASAPAP